MTSFALLMLNALVLSGTRLCQCQPGFNDASESGNAAGCAKVEDTLAQLVTAVSNLQRQVNDLKNASRPNTAKCTSYTQDWLFKPALAN